MAYLTFHRLQGDPEQLLDRKAARLDPVSREHAPMHGALLSATAPTEDGILIVNLWESAEGAAGLSQEPAMQDAQRVAQLPTPSSFERYEGASFEVTAGWIRPTGGEW